MDFPIRKSQSHQSIDWWFQAFSIAHGIMEIPLEHSNLGAESHFSPVSNSFSNSCEMHGVAIVSTHLVSPVRVRELKKLLARKKNNNIYLNLILHHHRNGFSLDTERLLTKFETPLWSIRTCGHSFWSLSGPAAVGWTLHLVCLRSRHLVTCSQTPPQKSSPPPQAPGVRFLSGRDVYISSSWTYNLKVTLNLFAKTWHTYNSTHVTRSNPLVQGSLSVTEPWYNSMVKGPSLGCR